MNFENNITYDKLIINHDENINLHKIIDPTKPIYFSYNGDTFPITFFNKCSNDELKKYLSERKIRTDFNRKKLIELCTNYAIGNNLENEYFSEENRIIKNTHFEVKLIDMSILRNMILLSSSIILSYVFIKTNSSHSIRY